MENRNVVPDDFILTQIFPDLRVKDVAVIVNNWDKCVFRVELETGSDQQPAVYIVRLEAERNDLQQSMVVAAIERIAATIIPDLVPRTLKTGSIRNEKGRVFQFSVTEFVNGDLLEDIWETIDTEDQNCIAADLADVLFRLSKVRLHDNTVMKVFEQTVDTEAGESSRFSSSKLGGPYMGFLDGGTALIDSIFERWKLQRPFCTLASVNDGIEVKSLHGEFESMVVRTADMEQWPEEAGLCHNDLNPRNIILCSQTLEGQSRSRYRLAAIIDWELAGFYPASFQLSLQNNYLGSANRHTSFYILLKEHMKAYVPSSPSQIALYQAMELIYESRQRYLASRNNIPALIRKRFLERSHMIRREDPYTGWVRDPDVKSIISYSASDFQVLQDSVIKEVTAAREAKMKVLRSSSHFPSGELR